jgi:CubicO group peptidase (beta-lactamase class C family)
MTKSPLLIALTILLAACSADAPSSGHELTADASNSDDKNLGRLENEFFWTFEQKIASYRNMDKITWTRPVSTGDNVYRLPKNAVDLGIIAFDFDNRTWTIDDFIEQTNVTGLIVVKEGVIIYERYEHGNTEASRWNSYSITKSVTSLLVGAAIEDGYIESVDEKVTDYLPRLKGSSYDQSSIRNLLQMASGVDWTEDYADPESDINVVPWNTLDTYEYLRHKPRTVESGAVFNYNTAETNLVGDLLRSAVGNNLSTYLSEKIWKPFGMEHDAYWELTEPGGGEFGGSSLNATLRDYARLGIFALESGVLPDGRRVLPEYWMSDSTTPSTSNTTYGYSWWLFDDGRFAANGIFGQRIEIDPASKVVIAMHSARDHASNPDDQQFMFAAYAAMFDAARNLGDDYE